MSKILVTGAGGFVGSRIVEMLLEKGHEVVAFFRYTSESHRGHLQDVTGYEAVFGDISSQGDVERAMEGCHRTIHLAAQIAIPWSYRSPHVFVNTNVIGTLNMLMAARKYKLERMVHTSTSEVYGSAQTEPMGEDHPQVAQSPYSASKIAADKLVQSFFHSFNLPVIIARPFNIYGPKQSGRAVIPSIILQALEKDTILLGSINARRDFNYIDDTARKMVMMLLSDDGTGEQFNLCSGRDYAIGDIVKMVGQILDKDLGVAIDDCRVRPANSEVSRLIGDGTYGQSIFRFGSGKPIIEGLEETVEYFKQHQRKEMFTL